MESQYGKLPRWFKWRMSKGNWLWTAFLIQFCFAAGYWTGSTILRIGAVAVSSTDKRLDQFRKDVLSQDGKEMEKRVLKLRQELSTQRQAVLKGRLAQAGPAASAPESAGGDDASPTGGSMESGGSYDQYNNSAILNEVYSQPSTGFTPSQQQRRPSSTSSLSEFNQTTPSSPSPPAQQTRSQSFWDDDASPTNPSIDTTLQTSTSTGSAWDRIRRSANSQGSSEFSPRAAASQPEQPPQSRQEIWQSSDSGALRDSGDRFSRGGAQQAYNEALERERSFGSDQDRDGGNAWGRRW